MIDLAFLAPDTAEAFVAGTHLLGFTSEWVKHHDLPSDWTAQREILAKL